MSTNPSQEKVVVAFAADDNYLQYLYVAATSVIIHARKDRLYEILVLYLGTNVKAANELISSLNCANVKVQLVDMSIVGMPDMYVSRHVSLATYCRLYLPEMFPNIDKIIYMDCDIITTDDISPLYDEPIGDSYLAGCLDMSYDIVPEAGLEMECGQFEKYVNAGVLVMNTAEMRKANLQEQLLECASHEHLMHDQSVLNIVCNGRIHILPDKWNFCLHNWPYNPIVKKSARKVCEGMIKTGEYKIIHYCSPRKPWKGNCISPLTHEWQAIASRTKFADEFNRVKKSLLVQILESLGYPRTIMHLMYWIHRVRK